MDSFDASGYLSKKYGLTYSHTDEKGDPFYITPEGKEIPLDVKGLLKKNGVPVEQFKLEYNSPNQALDASLPDISAADRAILAFGQGDPNGQAKWLKENKGLDVAQDKDKNLVVNKNGTWHRLDPSGFEMADVAELGPEFIQGVMQASGMVLGGLLGNVPGGMLGGATANYAGGELNARIGEWLGVRGDAGLSIRENVFDFITGAVPPAMEVGVRAGIPVLGAIKNMVKRGIPEGSKVVLQKMLTHADVSPGAAKELFQAGSANYVDKAITETAAKVGNEVGTTAALVERGIKPLGKMIDDTPMVLEGELKNTVNTVAKATSGKFKVNLASVVQDAERTLEQKGLARVLDTNVLELTDKSLTDSMKNTIQKTLSELNRYKTNKVTLSGPEAIKDVISMRAHLNNLVREVPAELRGQVKAVTDAINAELSKRFEKQGAYEVYSQAVNRYETLASAAKSVEKTVAEEGGIKKLADTLLQNPTGNDAIHLITKLHGEKGDAIARVVRQNMAASELVRKIPVVDAQQLYTTAGNLATGRVKSLVSSGIGMITNKNLVVKMAKRLEPKAPKPDGVIAEKMKPMVDAVMNQWGKLTPNQRSSIMFNPSALEAIINDIGISTQAKEELKQKVMQDASKQ